MSQQLTQSAASLLSAPATMLRVVTPVDNVLLPNGVCKFFQVAVGGTVNVLAVDDTTYVSLTVTAGQIVPVRAKGIAATGTTATGIVAMY